MLADDWFLCQNPSPALLEAVFALRVRAWKARQSRFASDIVSWSDAFDATAEHFVVVQSGIPIAAARLSIHARLPDGPDGQIYEGLDLDVLSPVGVLSRLVVCPSHARAGLPSYLDRARISRARAAGCRSVVAATNSGAVRLGQLEALGFRNLYEVHMQAPGPLECTLPPTIVALDLTDPYAEL